MSLDYDAYEIEEDSDVESVESTSESEAANNRMIDELIQPERRREAERRKEMTEADYKALAEKIAKTGEIPKELLEAVKNGFSDKGLDIDKLNELLKDKGMKLNLETLPNGSVLVSLTRKGRVIDANVVQPLPGGARPADNPAQGPRPAEAQRPAEGQRPGDGVRPGPREVTEEDIAKEIAQAGRIPDSIKKALEKGLNPNGKGLDLDKINKALEKMGSKHRLEIKPGPNGGVQVDLKKDGKVVDSYEATSPAARSAAERMRQRERENNRERERTPGDSLPSPKPRPADVLPPIENILPHREAPRNVSATLEVHEDRQILGLGDGQKLVVGENGSWYLKDKNGLVKIEPQITKEMRVPQWNALSNGGRVTFHDDRTEIVSGDYKVVIDAKGVKSVEYKGKPVPLERPAAEKPAGIKEVGLTTGDTLHVHQDKQVLKMTDGSKLVMKEDGNWYLTDKNGPVKVENQYTLEMRVPQWNSLSNGGRVTFHHNRTEISMPDGTTVSFDNEGLLGVSRGDKTHTLRKPSPDRPKGPKV